MYDGKIGTGNDERWTLNGSGDVIINFGSQKTFDTIRMCNDEGDYPSTYTVYVSNDNSTWTQVTTGSGTEYITTIKLSAEQTAQYLKINGTNRDSSHWWSIRELFVYDSKMEAGDSLIFSGKAAAGGNDTVLGCDDVFDITTFDDSAGNAGTGSALSDTAFNSDVSDELKAQFASSSDSNSIDSVYVGTCVNYIGCNTSGSTLYHNAPTLNNLTLTAGSYSLYYLGGSDKDFTVTFTENTSLNKDITTSTRIASDLYVYQYDFTLSSDYTGDIYFMCAENTWLPDLYSVKLVNTSDPEPTTAPTATPEAADAFAKLYTVSGGAISTTTGTAGAGRSNTCTDTYTINSGMEDTAYGIFNDSSCAAGYFNYISGNTDNNCGYPYISSLSLDAGAYKVYYLGHKKNYTVKATLGSTDLTTSVATSFANVGSNALYLYEFDFNLSEQLTDGTLSFTCESGYLPDLYAVAIVKTVSDASCGTVSGTATLGSPADTDTSIILSMKLSDDFTYKKAVTVPAGSVSADYTASGVPAGVYTVSASGDDLKCVPEHDTIAVSAGATTELEINSYAISDITASTTATVDTTETSSTIDLLSGLTDAQKTAVANTDAVTVSFKLHIEDSTDNANIHGDSSIHILGADTPASSSAIAGTAEYMDIKLNDNWHQIDMVNCGSGFSGSSNISNKQLLNAGGKFNVSGGVDYTVSITIDFANNKVTEATTGSSSTTYDFTMPSAPDRSKLCIAIYNTSGNSYNMTSLTLSYKQTQAIENMFGTDGTAEINGIFADQTVTVPDGDKIKLNTGAQIKSSTISSETSRELIDIVSDDGTTVITGTKVTFDENGKISTLSDGARMSTSYASGSDTVSDVGVFRQHTFSNADAIKFTVKNGNDQTATYEKSQSIDGDALVGLFIKGVPSSVTIASVEID